MTLPKVEIFTETNFNGTRSFLSKGTHTVKENFTQAELVGKTFFLVSAKLGSNGKRYALDNGGYTEQQKYWHLYEYSSSNINQVFTMLSNGTIKSVGNGLCMDVANGTFANGTRLWGYPQNNTAAQLWEYDSQRRYVKVKGKNFVLSIKDDKMANASVLHIWAPDGNVAQQWDVILCDVKEKFSHNGETYALRFYTDYKDHVMFSKPKESYTPYHRTLNPLPWYAEPGKVAEDPYAPLELSNKPLVETYTNNQVKFWRKDNANNGVDDAANSGWVSIGDYDMTNHVGAVSNRTTANLQAKWYKYGKNDAKTGINKVGAVANDDVASVTIDPHTDLFVYEHSGFGGKCLHIHNGKDAQWVFNLSTDGMKDKLSSYKIRAGLMDGKQTRDWSDTSGNSVCTIKYQAHVSNVGWMDWVSSGQQVGKTGQNIEAIRFMYSGPGTLMARAHVANKGWLGWVNSNTICGTTGEGLRLEAIEFKLDGVSNVQFGVSSYVNGSWQSEVGLNKTSGTTGQSKPVVLMKISCALKTVTATSNKGRTITLTSIPSSWTINDYDTGKLASFIGKPFVIKSNKNKSFVLDTAGRHNGGGECVIYQIQGSGNANQVWTTDKEGHLISWANRNSMLYCDNTKNGTKPKIIGYKGNETKLNTGLGRWRMTDAGDLVSLNHVDQGLAIAGDNQCKNNNPIVMWTKSSTANSHHKWSIESAVLDPGVGEFSKWVGKKFYITSKKNSKFLIDTEGHQNGGGFIKIYTNQNNKHNNQVWTVTADGQLQSVHNTNSILDAKDANNNTEPTIVGRSGNANANALRCKWSLTTDGYIVSRMNPNQCLDIKGGTMADSTRILMYTKGQGDHQKWVLVESDPKPADPGVGEFSKWVGKKFYITLKKDQSFVLDTEGHQNGGGRVVIYKNQNNGHNNQVWTVTADGQLQSIHNTNSILDAVDGGNDKEPKIVGRSGNANASALRCKWHLSASGEIISRAYPDKALAVYYAKIQNSQKVITYTKGQGDHQKWVLVEYIADPGVGEFSKWVGKKFYILSKKNSKFLIDTEGHQNGGGFIKIYENQNNGHNNQVWTVTADGQLQSVHNTNSILDARENKLSVEPHIVGRSGNANANTLRCKWHLTKTGEIVSRAYPGLCLDIKGGTMANSTRVVLYTTAQVAQRQWTLQEYKPNTAAATTTQTAAKPATTTTTTSAAVSQAQITDIINQAKTAATTQAKTTAEAAAKTIAESTAKNIATSTAKSIAESTAKSIAESVAKTTAESIAKSIAGANKVELPKNLLTSDDVKGIKNDVLESIEPGLSEKEVNDLITTAIGSLQLKEVKLPYGSCRLNPLTDMIVTEVGTKKQHIIHNGYRSKLYEVADFNALGIKSIDKIEVVKASEDNKQGTSTKESFILADYIEQTGNSKCVVVNVVILIVVILLSCVMLLVCKSGKLAFWRADPRKAVKVDDFSDDDDF